MIAGRKQFAILQLGDYTVRSFVPPVQNQHTNFLCLLQAKGRLGAPFLSPEALFYDPSVTIVSIYWIRARGAMGPQGTVNGKAKEKEKANV
jgi:hypothetical protein